MSNHYNEHYADDDSIDEDSWLNKPITRGDILAIIIGIGAFSGLDWLYDFLFK